MGLGQEAKVVANGMGAKKRHRWTMNGQWLIAESIMQTGNPLDGCIHSSASDTKIIPVTVHARCGARLSRGLRSLDAKSWVILALMGEIT